ncbi:ribonuclease H-like domain-containing protein [Tanacetum coccineum]
MSLNVVSMSPIPKSHTYAIRDTNWKNAMLEEYNVSITNGTWVLVPRPANVNVVRSMWLFRTPVDTDSKLGPDGDPVSDSTLYRSLACALQYLTFTRPNISYVVQQIIIPYNICSSEVGAGNVANPLSRWIGLGEWVGLGALWSRDLSRHYSHVKPRRFQVSTK